MKPNESAEKILVADDEPHIRRLLSFNIQQMGFQALHAADGAECLEVLQAERPSALLLDINMPKKDGFEILEYVAENCPELTVITVVKGSEVVGR